jgi:hypothetical protein
VEKARAAFRKLGVRKAHELHRTAKAKAPERDTSDTYTDTHRGDAGLVKPKILNSQRYTLILYGKALGADVFRILAEKGERRPVLP